MCLLEHLYSCVQTLLCLHLLVISCNYIPTTLRTGENSSSDCKISFRSKHVIWEYLDCYLLHKYGPIFTFIFKFVLSEIPESFLSKMMCLRISAALFSLNHLLLKLEILPSERHVKDLNFMKHDTFLPLIKKNDVSVSHLMGFDFIQLILCFWKWTWQTCVRHNPLINAQHRKKVLRERKPTATHSRRPQHRPSSDKCWSFLSAIFRSGSLAVKKITCWRHLMCDAWVAEPAGSDCVMDTGIWYKMTPVGPLWQFCLN